MNTPDVGKPVGRLAGEMDGGQIGRQAGARPSLPSLPLSLRLPSAPSNNRD